MGTSGAGVFSVVHRRIWIKYSTVPFDSKSFYKFLSLSLFFIFLLFSVYVYV